MVIASQPVVSTVFAGFSTFVGGGADSFFLPYGTAVTAIIVFH
ncbi:hypothetical protein HMPREF1861_00235 [Corynebacterium kroppenstedtii]|nr:hypothetical protein HMPREF1861_00235 [Corynebacterium kroppenstedtii]